MKSYITILLAFLVVTGCKKELPPEQEVLRPVRYDVIRSVEASQQRTYTGVAIAGTESKLSFRVAGAVEYLPVKVGQEVRKGQLVASIDDSDYELMYEEADAAVKNADAAEKNTESNFDRISRLYENENVSLSEYEAAKAAFQSAKANEKAAKQRRKLAEAQIGYTQLRAAFNGVIADVLIEENENVSAGQPVVILTSSDEIEIEVSIPDFFINAVKEGDNVLVDVSTVTDEPLSGTVTEVAYASTYETTYPVRVKLNDSKTNVRPGMTASVTFDVPESSDAPGMHVPAQSVAEDRSGRFVFVVQDSSGVGVIKRKPVEIGELSDRGIAITSGLTNGDWVVTAGVSKITEGMHVKLLD